MRQGGDPEARTVMLLRIREGGPSQAEIPVVRLVDEWRARVGGRPGRSRMQEVVAATSMEIGTEQIVVPDTVEELLGDLDAETDVPWVVLVWDDPINLMDYVTYVFQKLFGYSRAKARQLMLQVHNEGKAVVSSGTRERCENDVARLHAHGLWATMQHDK